MSDQTIPHTTPPEPTASRLVGKRLGEFALVREIGRGGMGVVFEAVQTSLNRKVALKVLGPGLGLTPRAVDRFRREAAAAAKLHHTNVVPVFATGEQDGVYFYAMELIDGPALDAVIRQLREQKTAANTPVVPSELVTTNAYTPSDPLTSSSAVGTSGGSAAGRFDRIAAMIADVADALHHAHTNGVTHRDIKPSNLMLASDGRLSVTDFGLARMLEEPGMTVTGEFVGTPAYMSPEQITAGRIPVDHRTDLYSLGATLYELLTLRPPFVADGRDRLLAMVIQKEPPTLRSVDPKVPRDLETICLKCLEKDPDRRYQSAKALADDLRRYVQRFAILARRTGPFTKLKKWVKRNPALAGAGLAVLLAVGVAGFFAWRADRSEQRRIADERLRDEEVRGERMRAAVDRALAETMAGRLTAAEDAVREAEQLGAPMAHVKRLRGQIALIQGDHAKAVEELTQATELDPGGVAGWGLLATAYGLLGNDTSYRRVVADHLEGSTPRTAEDYLYMGQALAVWETSRGLPLMQRAIELRDGAIPRSVRGDILSAAALSSENPVQVEQALVDVQVARGLLGDANPMAVANCLRAHTAAAWVFEAAGRPERSREFWDRAEADARVLAAHARNPAVAPTLGAYYLFTGRDDTAVLRTVLNDPGRNQAAGIAACHYAISVLRRAATGEYPTAVRWLDEAERLDPANDVVVIHRLLLLTDMGEANRQRAKTEYDQFVRRTESPVPRLFAAAFLLLDGRVGEARAAYEHLRTGTFPPALQGPYVATCDHFSGRPPSEADVISRASGRHLKAEVSYFLGLGRLVVGDRDGAKRHFGQAARRYSCYDLMATYWSLAFLTRMEKDPAWPPWIPAKK